MVGGSWWRAAKITVMFGNLSWCGIIMPAMASFGVWLVQWCGLAQKQANKALLCSPTWRFARWPQFQQKEVWSEECSVVCVWRWQQVVHNVPLALKSIQRAAYCFYSEINIWFCAKPQLCFKLKKFATLGDTFWQQTLNFQQMLAYIFPFT